MLALLKKKKPYAPFGDAPRADRDTYLRLHEEARAVDYPEITAFEKETGFAVDRAWMEELALHTQVVIKQSRLNYQHGRILYAALRRYIEESKPGGQLQILETGTARGFSTVCTARALHDAGQTGTIVTVDLLPHSRPIYWNCIDDHDGPKSRKELLGHYSDLLQNILFVEGPTKERIPQLGMQRINFAFLDAAHTFEDVMEEFSFVKGHQKSGDTIVFDDVTPDMFPGVVQAVDHIEKAEGYAIQRLQVSEQRGYAIAKKL